MGDLGNTAADRRNASKSPISKDKKLNHLSHLFSLWEGREGFCDV
jgi:hypothetical protein